jgi:lipoate-protein ligase A
MSVDEGILRTTSLPVLRVYGWKEPAISFGCLMPIGEVRAATDVPALVRRWTGGGIVAHGGDWTYSLIVPAAEGFCGRSTMETYAGIHGRLAGELRRDRVSVTTVSDRLAGFGGVCFARPVTHDLVCDGRKIAGAAQRRCRQGLLHQGSVQGIDIAADFAQRFARTLARHVITTFDPSSEAEALAETLCQKKYGTDEWLRRR